METLDAIYGRRAVRAYRPQRIDRETIDALIDAAIQAPSAMNSQPWAFVVIQDEKLLKRYSDEAKTAILGTVDEKSRENQYIEFMKDPAFNIFYDATTAIVICDKPDGHDPSGD